MSEQQAIAFNPVTPVAANADPHTSHVAARRVTRDGTRGRQADEVLRLVRAYPGLTSQELSEHSVEVGYTTPLDRYQVARRLSELADPANGGLIERGEARECTVTRHLALTWRVVRAEGWQ